MVFIYFHAEHKQILPTQNRRQDMQKIKVMLLLVALVWMSVACSASRKTKGAVIGAGSGAAAGAVIGKAAGNTLLGAIIGAAVGGAAGAYIGNYMDKQAREIEQDIAGAQVERVGEGIKITFDSGLLFDVDKAELSAQSKQELADLAKILNKYPDTDILIEGHTDSSGPEDYNLTLSEKRAKAVASYLASLGVDPRRFTTVGYGELQPIADNDTPEGRQKNRRVDIAIMANERLKEIAKKQAG
jgi:outer membrane protein OmpA-like peptidoglycan-associated protein